MICAFDRVYESWNQGNTWEDISGALAGGSNMEQLAIAPSNTNRIYVARAGTVWVKDPLSNTWESHDLPAASPSDLEVDHIDIDKIYVTIPGYTDGSKVFRSTDAGANWENISGSLPNVSTGSIETYDMVAGGLFVGTDAGVYYRDDTYDDWQLYGSIPNTRVEDIEIQYSGQKIRIGTHGRGVLEADVNIGLCDDDADSDGICDEYDACPGFDDTLLGTPCNDGNSDTVDDIYIDCDVCEGILDVSISELNATPFSIFPNPTDGYFRVTNRLNIEGSINVYNPLGQIILTQELEINSVFDLTNYSAGIYTVHILAQNGRTLDVKRLQVK
jgi:hypothetical protein